MPTLLPFAVDRADITPYYEALADALNGRGPALAPYDAAGPRPDWLDDDRTTTAVAQAPDDLALVVSTSGSTGTPKRAMLTSGALVASAVATHERIGAGTWLLPLPPHHIAGTQVIVRSIVAGTTPIVLPEWSLEWFTKATALVARNAPPFSPIHTSLVPTQLRAVLDDAAALAAARRYRAILVGGAATPSALQERARAAGLAIRTTYGSSETSGGCVYDGEPLNGVTVHVLTDPDEPDGPDATPAVGRIALSGPMLASGYLGDAERTQAAFVTVGGAPAFLTDDLGWFDGRLHLIGRVDDVINTGGYKVSPRVVEEAALAVEGVRDAVVVGLTHEKWGQGVALAISPEPPHPDETHEPDDTDDAAETHLIERVLTHCRATLPGYAVPVQVAVWDTIPLKGIGKPDRAVIAASSRWQNVR